MKTAISIKNVGSIQLNSKYFLIEQKFINNNFLKVFYLPNLFSYYADKDFIYFSHKNKVDSFISILNRWLYCFNTLQIISFELWGLGLSLMPLESWWKTGRIWVFKVGFSHRIFVKEPYNLRIVWQHRLSDFRRRKFFMMSSDLMMLKSLAFVLKHLQTLNLYKFRGFKFSNEKVAIKLGKVTRF